MGFGLFSGFGGKSTRSRAAPSNKLINLIISYSDERIISSRK
jgi:hypothetical protein